MRDVKTGYLHEMNFLSKSLVTCGNRVECYRMSSKVAMSGIASEKISARLTIPQFCRMMCYQFMDLPKRLTAVY